MFLTSSALRAITVEGLLVLSIGICLVVQDKIVVTSFKSGSDIVFGQNLKYTNIFPKNIKRIRWKKLLQFCDFYYDLWAANSKDIIEIFTDIILYWNGNLCHRL